MKNLLLSIISFFILIGSAYADPATVIYFTAGTVPTVSEAADIALLQTGGAQRLKVLVRNSALDNGNEVSKADYVASVDGSTNIPEDYSEIDVIDQDSLLIVENGDTVVVKNSAGSISKNGTALVENEALTQVNLAATVTILTHSTAVSGITITGDCTTGTSTFTPTISAGVLTGGACSD